MLGATNHQGHQVTTRPISDYMAVTPAMPSNPTDVDRWLGHFNLRAMPFTRAIPEDGLFPHKSFSEALSRLSLGVHSKTPTLLTAEPGLGKSTLLGHFSDSLDKGRYRLVYTALCSCKPYGLVGQLAARYGIKPKLTASQTAQVMLDELMKSGKHEILVLDEGQRLPAESLDELRLLSNLDFDRTPPFALVLAGQPELRSRLLEPDHDSLWQRLSIRATLTPLSDRETVDYIDRRMRAVGAMASVFRPGASDKIFERSQGVPRKINNLATASLLAAGAAGKKHVDVADVENASFDQENS
jgi:type II secretory pathway predicted ATPase ExeA